MNKGVTYLIICFSLFGCGKPQEVKKESILNTLSNLESISGKSEYLNSPFVTAGDRVYLVGHQDGSFPDLGWHVEGEMGGIWDHPIKLMDGFTLGVGNGTNYWCLTDAEQFINFPVGNRHEFNLGEYLSATRVQFVPDGVEGLVLEYTFQNTGSETQNLSLDFTGMVDLSPVWLADSLGLTDGADRIDFDQELGVWIGSDPHNEWYTLFGSDQKITKWQSDKTDCSYQRRGKGVDATVSLSLSVGPEQTESVRFFIAGSYQSRVAAVDTYERLKNESDELLQQKMERYRSIKNTTDLTIPDNQIQKMYTWTKYNTDWLIRDVPEQGRGLSAGIPDYPWWFGTDNTYALRGLLATGRHDEVKKTIELILKLSRKVNDNGRIMHEASTNGVVFNPGNLNTTPYFIDLMWKYYLWTGDRTLLEEVYPDIKAGLTWLERQDEDGNGYPDGAGMMEIHGLHSEMIDVVVYMQAAYASASEIAREMKEADQANLYARKAQELKQKINSDWWVEPASSFADFRASRVKTLQLIDDAILRADTLDKPWAVDELEITKRRIGRLRDNKVQGHVVHHNWVVNTPLETGVASADHAEKALETARRYRNSFGMYVTGIDRDEQQEGSSKWQAFSYVGAVMTLPTGVQAIAEANYGHPDAALSYLLNLTNGFSYALPGSMYEVSPDYGMIAQAWNIYAVATPIIEKFFGIHPNAGKQEIVIQPLMPSEWEEATLRNVVVGNNQITIEKSGAEYTLSQTQPDWTILFIDSVSDTLKLSGLKNVVSLK